MMACTSPAATSRSRPLRMFLPSTRTLRPLMLSILVPLSRRIAPLLHFSFLWERRSRRRDFSFSRRIAPLLHRLSHGAFEGDLEELLGFDGELHRQLAEHVLAEAVHDHVRGVLFGDAA